MELELVRTGATLHDDHSVQFGSYSVYAFERKRDFVGVSLRLKVSQNWLGFVFGETGMKGRERVDRDFVGGNLSFKFII